MRYVDPTGEFVIPLAIPVLPAIGTVIAKGVALAGAVIVGLVLGDAASEIINGESQEESENQKAGSVKQQLESNAQATAPNPMPPDDDSDDNDSKFKSSKETAKDFNTNPKDFERNIKKDILKDSKLESKSNNQLKKFLDKNKNPDIGIDSSGNIWLKSRSTGEIIKTPLNKNMYID